MKNNRNGTTKFAIKLVTFIISVIVLIFAVYKSVSISIGLDYMTIFNTNIKLVDPNIFKLSGVLVLLFIIFNDVIVETRITKDLAIIFITIAAFILAVELVIALLLNPIYGILAVLGIFLFYFSLYSNS